MIKKRHTMKWGNIVQLAIVWLGVFAVFVLVDTYVPHQDAVWLITAIIAFPLGFFATLHVLQR